MTYLNSSDVIAQEKILGDIALSGVLGADPEGFLVDPTSRHITCPEILGVLPARVCTRPDPREAGVDTREQPLVADGAQLELHPDAGTCRQYFIGRVRRALLYAKLLANAYNLKFLVTPAINVPRENMKQFLPGALECGCKPDWEAYTMKNTLENAPAFDTHFKRYGGGHIHMSISTIEQIFSECAPEIESYYPLLAILLDATAGLYNVITSPVPKLAAERRKLFGKAGTFRKQPWGIEYRTLDNSWLLHPKLFYATTSVIRFLSRVMRLSPRVCLEVVKEHAPALREIINTCDQSAARALWPKITGTLEDGLKEFFKTCRYNNPPNLHTMEDSPSTYITVFDKFIKPEMTPEQEEPNWEKWCITDEDMIVKWTPPPPAPFGRQPSPNAEAKIYLSVQKEIKNLLSTLPEYKLSPDHGSHFCHGGMDEYSSHFFS